MEANAGTGKLGALPIRRTAAAHQPGELSVDIIDPRLGIGGNNPPGPFETVRDRIDDLFVEAEHWLDGKPVTTQAEADGISKLLDLVRKAEKEADAERISERRPHVAAADAVQTRYRPVLERAKLLADTCKSALTPWLRQEAEKAAAKAVDARRIADEKAAAAKKAFEMSGPEDLAGREAAEVAFREAIRAEAKAVRTGRDRPHAKGGTRAVSLRTRYAPVVKDFTVLARYGWERHREEMEAFLLSLAEQDVRRGLRDIPGVEIIRIEEAV
jgi:hypothetical protein